jgi:Ribonuclease G/E
MCEPCPTCAGKGQVRATAAVAYEVLRRIRREATMNAPLQRVTVSVHPDVAGFLAEYEPAALRELERELQIEISLRQSRDLGPAQYEVAGVAAMPGTG